MTEQTHPMVPPNILLNNWESDWFAERENADVLLIQAYQAGADAELEACCEWLNAASIADELDSYDLGPIADDLRAARRPKPPSLKTQALQALENADGADHPVVATVLTADQHALIRKALEQLDD